MLKASIVRFCRFKYLKIFNNSAHWICTNLRHKGTKNMTVSMREILIRYVDSHAVLLPVDDGLATTQSSITLTTHIKKMNTVVHHSPSGQLMFTPCEVVSKFAVYAKSIHLLIVKSCHQGATNRVQSTLFGPHAACTARCLLIDHITYPFGQPML